MDGTTILDGLKIGGVVTGIFGTIAAIIAYFPTKQTSRAAERKVMMEERKQEKEEDDARIKRIEADRDRAETQRDEALAAKLTAEKRATEFERQLMMAMANCVAHGCPCAWNQASESLHSLISLQNLAPKALPVITSSGTEET